MSKNLPRRMFLKISATMAAAGILAWKPATEFVESAPIIGADPAQEGGHTSVFPDLYPVITTGHREQPFALYFVGPVDNDF